MSADPKFPSRDAELHAFAKAHAAELARLGAVVVRRRHIVQAIAAAAASPRVSIPEGQVLAEEAVTVLCGAVKARPTWKGQP